MAKSGMLDPDLWRFGPTFDMVVCFGDGAEASRFLDGVLSCNHVTHIDGASDPSGATPDGVVRAILRSGAIEVGLKTFVHGDDACFAIHPGFLARAIGDATNLTLHMANALTELVELHRALLCLYAHADSGAWATQVILQEETWSFWAPDVQGVTLHAAVARALGLEGAAVDEGVMVEWEGFWEWARRSCRG